MMFESEKASSDFCKEVSSTGEARLCNKTNREHTLFELYTVHSIDSDVC